MENLFSKSGFHNYASCEVRRSTNVWLFKLLSIITTTAEICKMIGQGPVCPRDDDVTRSCLVALEATIDSTLHPIVGRRLNLLVRVVLKTL